MKFNMLAAGAVVAATLGLAACGSSPGDRAVSGAALGAGTGAIIGAATGTAATGAAIGAGVGAVAGAATTPRDDGYYDRDRDYRDRRECSYGPDYWDRHGGPRAYHDICD
jgi:hypothetical protein